MMIRAHWRVAALAALIGLPLAACQGNLGSGSGLSIPQGPQPYGQPNGPGAQAVTRERAVDGAVYLSSPLPDLPLPTVNGFGIDIALGTPGPSPSPSPSASAALSGKASRRTKTSYVARPQVVAQVVASPVAAPTPAPSLAPNPTTSAGSAGASGTVTHLSEASPVAGATGSAAPGSPAPAASDAGSVRHHTHPAPVASGPKITTKLVAYPDDAPVAPTPEPTGNVQAFVTRSAIVRGYLLPSVDVPIYGLAAIRFTVPKEELTPNRGYTIAVFTSAKKHRGKLLEYDTAPTVASNDIVSTFADDPLIFKKNIGYEIVLYGDQLNATPVPVPSSYPAPGNNPLVTPVPSGYSQQPYPGTPVYGATPAPQGYPTAPYPSQTYFR